MESKTDFRIRKTCAALIEAMLQLMNEKHFEEITIQELCARAMVRRATFYNHFPDKNAFFSFAVREMLSRFNEEIQGDIRCHDYWGAIVRHMVNFTKQNQQMIFNMRESNVLSTLMNILSEQINAVIFRRLQQEETHGVVLPALPVIMAPFYTGALVNTIRWWISDQNEMPEAMLVSQIMTLFRVPMTDSQPGAESFERTRGILYAR